MARSSARILDDDEEIDLLNFMLDACAIDSEDFFFDERVLTKENLEKNFNILLKMVENRSFRRSSYFVIGYLILITGIKVSESLRQEILENTRFSDEKIRWFRKEDEIERKVYLKDFQEKIQAHGSRNKMHPIRLIYFNGNQNLYTDNRSEVIIGLKELQEKSHSEDINNIHHILLQGEGLTTVPDSLYNYVNLESLSLEYNQIKHVPENFSELTSLKTLYLAYNEFTTFPESIIKLPSLRFLLLDNNYITELPRSLRNFISLKELSIRMNNINKIPFFLRDANFKIDYKFYNYP